MSKKVKEDLRWSKKLKVIQRMSTFKDGQRRSKNLKEV